MVALFNPKNLLSFQTIFKVDPYPKPHSPQPTNPTPTPPQPACVCSGSRDRDGSDGTGAAGGGGRLRCTGRTLDRPVDLVILPHVTLSMDLMLHQSAGCQSQYS